MPSTLEVLRRKARNARNRSNASNTTDSGMSPAAREAYEERLSVCLEAGVDPGIAETLAARSAGKVKA